MNDITEGLDLLGDFLDAKGYTEEAGLCTRAMDEINRLYEWKDKAGDIDRVKTVELVDLRAENARLLDLLDNALGWLDDKEHDKPLLSVDSIRAARAALVGKVEQNDGK